MKQDWYKCCCRDVPKLTEAAKIDPIPPVPFYIELNIVE